MFKIPASFRDDYENYLVMHSMKNFLLNNEIVPKYTMSRADLINQIEKFANESDENLEIVLDWLDEVLKEGIKHIHIRKVNTNSECWKKLIEMKEIPQKLLLNPDCRHICGNNKYDENVKLVKCEKRETNRGTVLSFYFAELICIHGPKCEKTIIYPIFIDIYFKYGLITGRAKSKTSMCLYSREKVNLEERVTTTTSKEIKRCFEFLAETFGIEYIKQEDANEYFKKKFYTLLNKYTQTPEIIKNKIEEKREKNNKVVDTILGEICEIDEKYRDDLEADVLNLIEKYLSISYPDKNIFIDGRDAYPLKIIATDEEESHLEQASGLEKPLQSKAIFFDNKKMMQKNQKCDGIIFSFEDKKKKERFKVEMKMERTDCFLRSNGYISEEELQNVLFAIIEAE